MNRFIPYSQPGSFGITTELWRVERDGSLIERVDPLDIGPMSINCNENVATKRIVTIATDSPRSYRPFLDFLMPVLTITDPEGNRISGPQGVYMVVPSNSTTDPNGTTGSIEARDLTELLDMATLDNAVCPAGMDRGAYCRQLALEMGFPATQIQIPDIEVLQPEDRVWDPGTTVLQVMTDLMVGSNWYQPWFTLDGKLITAPTKPRTAVAPDYIYTNATDDDASDIEGVITESPDWNRLANAVTVRKIGNEDTPTISYTARNTNPQSPASYTNLGIWISKATVDNHDLIDAEQARIQAENLLSESASQYVKLSLPTFPVVGAEVHGTVGLEIRRGAEVIHEGTYWRDGYTLTLDGGQTRMVLSLNRVEEWSNE